MDAYENPASAASTTEPQDTRTGIQDPRVSEDLGRRLAERLSPLAPDALVIWDDLHDGVLAHVVARELGCRLVYAYDNDGLAELEGSVEAGSRAVLVSHDAPAPTTVAAAQALLSTNGSSLIAIGTVAPLLSVGGDDERVRLVSLNP